MLHYAVFIKQHIRYYNQNSLMILHTGAHILGRIIWFMRKLQKNSMMIKSEISIMNICAAALVHYAAICGFHETVYAEL